MRRGETIPFNLTEDIPLIAIDVFLNAKGPFTFVVDTGASLTVLSPDAARRAGIRVGTAKHAKSLGIDGYQDIKIASIDSFQVGTIIVRQIDIGVMSLGRLCKGTDLRLQGILGYNFLKHFTLSVDYANSVLRFAPNKTFPRERSGSRENLGPSARIRDEND